MLTREARDRFRILAGLKIPEHMDRDGRTATSERVDVARVREFVVHVDGGGVLEKFPEARAGVGKAPRGRFDEESFEGGAGAAKLSRGHGENRSGNEMCVARKRLSAAKLR